jgi:hypothetical protein
MFSAYGGPSTNNDLWYQDVALHAAAGRTVIYPSHPGGLDAGLSVLGSRALARLANESGGRQSSNSNDLSVAYRRAQRDLGCRYAVGFYIDAEEATRPRSVRVHVKGDYEIRAPELFRTWSEQQRRASRMRAAFADPDNFSDPLLRAHVFPLRPVSSKAWEAIVTLQFPLNTPPEGVERNVAASLTRDGTLVKKISEELRVEPQQGKPEVDLPVIIVGNVKLKPGSHELRFVLSESGGDALQTTRVEFMIPEIPQGELILRGPILARVIEEGLLIATKGSSRDTLDALIGADASLEPLMVHQIDPDDTLLARWEVCAIGGKSGPNGTIRRMITADGEEAHVFEPVALDLQGKKVRCQGVLDRVPAGTLASGRYRFLVEVWPDTGEELLARGLAPFGVRGADDKVPAP